MKLLAKTSLYYLILSIPILIVSGFICYYIIINEVKDSSNDLLMNRKNLIEKYLQEKDTILLQLIIQSKEAQIKKVTLNKTVENIFSDTLILDKKENELAQNRLLTAVVKIKKQKYEIKISRSTLEFNELFEGIFTSFIILLFLLFVTYLIINFWISKILWQPFQKTINSLKTFRANDNSIPLFEKTSVKEFKDLNNSLIIMMEKMIVDYNSQKKFTENASHEFQTPLAVIKSKIDLLIQSTNLKENEGELIVAIDDACSKLIRINKSLLLLTKIENLQFKTTEKVAVSKMINQSITLFEEQIKANKILLKTIIHDDFIINMNSDLCLVLVNNLMQNAIRHNFENGIITITITVNNFTISNTGIKKPLDDSTLFERFNKNSKSHLSTGLGLAIAHEIAEVSGLALYYHFNQNQHQFTLKNK